MFSWIDQRKSSTSKKRVESNPINYSELTVWSPKEKHKWINGKQKKSRCLHIRHQGPLDTLRNTTMMWIICRGIHSCQTLGKLQIFFFVLWRNLSNNVFYHHSLAEWCSSDFAKCYCSFSCLLSEKNESKAVCNNKHSLHCFVTSWFCCHISNLFVFKYSFAMLWKEKSEYEQHYAFCTVLLMQFTETQNKLT